MRILGIDPGLANTGWGIVDFDGHKFHPVCYGTVNTLAKEKLELRVAQIAERVGQIADQYGAQVLSIEDIFFAKNELSAIGVAKVIGAICHCMYTRNIPVSIFTPIQIKLAITGYGRADKKQVQEMTRLLTGLDKIPKPDHAADAIAAAICFGNNAATNIMMGKSPIRSGKIK